MARIGSKGTGPERMVRSMLHRMGYRFRLHPKDLPGKPDITLPKHKKIVFVHGCFWHGHQDCPRAKRPTTNKDFWNNKLDKNITRDKRVLEELSALGWQVLIIWTCQCKHTELLKRKLTAFLEMTV